MHCKLYRTRRLKHVVTKWTNDATHEQSTIILHKNKKLLTSVMKSAIHYKGIVDKVKAQLLSPPLVELISNPRIPSLVQISFTQYRNISFA